MLRTMLKTHAYRFLLLLAFFIPAPLPGQSTSNPPAGKAAAATVVPAEKVPTPKTETREDFFARAQKLSDLESAGIPFHLKATYTAAGNTEFTGNGTYEEWWVSKGEWRKDTTLESYRLVEITKNGETSAYSSSPYVPLRLRQAIGALSQFVPYPTDAEGSNSKWTRQPEQIVGLTMTNFIRKYPCPAGNGSIQCSQQYFFAPQGMLRIYADEARMTLFNDFSRFHGVEVPRSVTIAKHGDTLLTATVNTVEALGPAQKASMENMSTIHSLQPQYFFGTNKNDKLAVVPGKLLKQASVVYPMAAKEHRIEGIVMINAGIDAHGKVREPYVFLSTAPPLDDAALKAIRKYKYSPLTLNGRPTMVETTVVFDFSLDY